jgi:outer membrane protein assembly factor BamB
MTLASLSGCVESVPFVGSSCRDGDATADWTQYRGDAARTGALATAAGPTCAPDVAWTAAASRPPAVVDGVVYAAEMPEANVPGGLAAGTGEPLWSRDPTEQAVTPAVAGGTAVLATDRGVCAVDADGSQRWRQEFDQKYTATTLAHDGETVVGGGVLAGEDDRTLLFGLDADSGERLWRRTPKFGSGRQSPVVAVGDGSVVVAAGSVLVSLSAADGSERWRVTTASGDRLSPPALRDGGVYVTSLFGDVRAYALSDGATRWRGPDSFQAWPVAVDDESVYAATGTGLVALSPTDGSERWRYDGRDALEGKTGLHTPTVAGDTVYSMGFRQLFAVSAADGSERWRIELGSVQSVERPAVAVAEGRLYVVASGEDDFERLHALGG